MANPRTSLFQASVLIILLPFISPAEMQQSLLTSTNTLSAKLQSTNFSAPPSPKSIPLQLTYIISVKNNCTHGGGEFTIRDAMVDFVNKNSSVLPFYNVSVITFDTRVSNFFNRAWNKTPEQHYVIHYLNSMRSNLTSEKLSNNF